MILTKLNSSISGFFEYINLEHIESIETHTEHGHYCCVMTSGRHIHVALADPTITTLVGGA